MLTLLLVLAPSAVLGSIIEVNPEGPLTIQAAVDMAQDGDQIVLLNGTFTGPGNRDITFRGKQLIVRSEDNLPALCTIDCQGSAADPHRGFRFEDGETLESVVSGITITNGYMNDWGGGIMVAYPSRITVRKCYFVNNHGSEGGGMSSSHSSHIVDCVFAYNDALAGAGYSASMSWTDTATLERCLFLGNVAVNNGGGFRA